MKTITLIGAASLSLMALNTFAAEAVNGQITDSVSQANVKVVGESPAMAMGQFPMTISASAQEDYFVSEPVVISCGGSILNWNTLTLQSTLNVQCASSRISFNRATIDGRAQILLYKPGSAVIITSYQPLPEGFSEIVQFCNHDPNNPSTVTIVGPNGLQTLKSQPSDEGAC